MSVKVSFELPEEVLGALRQSPREFTLELRMAAAVKWYEVGAISQSKAADLAGVSRAAFIDALKRFRVSPFQASAAEIAEEVSRG